MSDMAGNLTVLQKTMDKYVFRFETEDNKVYRDRMQKLLGLNKSFMSESFFKVKDWVLEHTDFETPNEEYINNLYDYCIGLVKQGHYDIMPLVDPLDMEKVAETNRIILPYFMDLLKKVVPTLNSKELNGTKTWTVDAVLTKIFAEVIEEWEKHFKRAYILDVKL